MAYTFLVEADNSLFASNKEVIMQRSKLVDTVEFLVNPEYKLEDMSIFSVVLEYILPVSKKYHTRELVKDENGYEEYLRYIIPADTNITSEAGDIQLQLSFTFVGLDADGNGVQKVRKTKVGKLHITPVAAWSDIVPDSALSALDQRIIKVDAQIKALNDTAITINDNKADNIKYNTEDSTLQLLSGDKEIGDKVIIGDSAILEDGLPVVEFNTIPSEPSDDDDNVIEFD